MPGFPLRALDRRQGRRRSRRGSGRRGGRGLSRTERRSAGRRVLRVKGHRARGARPSRGRPMARPFPSMARSIKPWGRTASGRRTGPGPCCCTIEEISRCRGLHEGFLVRPAAQCPTSKANRRRKILRFCNKADPDRQSAPTREACAIRSTERDTTGRRPRDHNPTGRPVAGEADEGTDLARFGAVMQDAPSLLSTACALRGSVGSRGFPCRANESAPRGLSGRSVPAGARGAFLNKLRHRCPRACGRGRSGCRMRPDRGKRLRRRLPATECAARARPPRVRRARA